MADSSRLEQRVVRAAQSALDDQKFVSPIDVFVRMGWLAPSHVDYWRQGRVDYLERDVQASLGKLTRAMQLFRRWAAARGLQPRETVYLARTRDRRQLRFSASGKPAIERAYRTHWVSPALSEAKRQRLADKQSTPPDLVVIWPLKEWTCANCARTGDLLFMTEAGPTCLPCAGLDHLVYLPSGDAGLTRRARKASGVSAVVVRYSRSRHRYERQGLLVEPAALKAAEQPTESTPDG